MREGGEYGTKVEQNPIGHLAGDAMENLCGPTVTTSFHDASALQAIVDLIEDGDGGEVLMESGHEAIDYQRRNRCGAVTRVVQARSGSEPYSVISSDLWGAVRRWAALEAPEATFVLHTNGHLFPTAVPAVADRLTRFSRECPSAEDVHVIKVVGLLPDSRLLRHVRLRSGAGPGSAVRADVTWRVQRLMQHNSGSARQDADEVTDRLLVLCAAAGCSGEPAVITQEEAARMAGIDIADLEGTGNWGSELAAHYRPRLPAAGGVEEPDALPVAVQVRHAVVGGLHSALRRSVEAVTGRPLSAAGARQLLASPNLVLRIEGHGDAAGPGTLLAEEVRAAQAMNPSMQVVALAEAGP
jgi:hypothetical protein